MSKIIIEYFFCLLIVPYGIETTHCSFWGVVQKELLIVPYGIETLYTMKCSSTPYLLIVPYGIETSQNAKILKITIFF